MIITWDSKHNWKNYGTLFYRLKTSNTQLKESCWLDFVVIKVHHLAHGRYKIKYTYRRAPERHQPLVKVRSRPRSHLREHWRSHMCARRARRRPHDIVQYRPMPPIFLSTVVIRRNKTRSRAPRTLLIVRWTLLRWRVIERNRWTHAYSPRYDWYRRFIGRLVLLKSLLISWSSSGYLLF